MAKIEPRPEVLVAPSTHHGALNYGELERLRIEPDDVLDFSVNSNPFGPSPKVREALRTVPLDRYPDREALALRRALAARLGVEVRQIAAGNGTAEVLWLVALAFVRPGDCVLVVNPTFDEYARAAALMGARIETWTAPAEKQFAISPDAVCERLAALKPRLAFCCNPNNPTGAAVSLETITDWAAAYPETLFVVDEAYINFAPGVESVVGLDAHNLLTLRSMTKDYALAGLRLGYAVGPAGVIDALVRARPPWSVNALAQAAGLAALADDAYLRRTLAQLHAEKPELVAGLHALGFTPLPSSTHYFLVEVGDAAAFRGALLRRGVMVRDCTSFGLPGYVRIATRRPDQNARLLAAIREVLA
jgi:histidinol-phosphate aminotransferase